MGIRRKVIVLVGSTIIALLVMVYLLVNYLLLNSFLTLEREQVVQNVFRLDNAIDSHLNNLDVKIADWGRWDDVYQFVNDRNQGFIDSNLGPTSVRNLGINTMVYLDLSGEVVISQSVYGDEDSSELPAGLNEFLASSIVIAKYNATNTITNANISHDIISLRDGPMMVAYGPVVHSDGAGPVNGVIMFGRWLDQDLIAELSQTIELGVTVEPYRSDSDRADLFVIEDGHRVGIDYLNNEQIQGFLFVDDAYGQSVAKASVIFDRSVYVEGVQAINLFFLLYLSASVVIFILIILVIEFFILRRFVLLNNNLTKIRTSGDLDLRISLTGKDEFANLGNNIDSMLRELDLSHQAIKEKDSKLATEAKRITKQNKDLEKAQLAMINVLEDIDHEKSIVEETVKIRTKELSTERAKLLASITSLPLGFSIIDPDYKIVTHNDILLNIFGFSEVSFVEIERKMGEKFDLAAAVDQVNSHHLTIIKEEVAIGRKFVKLFLAPIIATEDGNVIGCLLLVEDITERKLIERTREEFFAVASHELRTPLTAIRGNMSMIREFILPKFKDRDLAEMVDDSYDSAIRLITIVNDFLDASRLEQGRISLKQEVIDIMDVINDVVDEVEGLAEAKKLSLAVLPAPKGSLAAFVDRDRVKQVIFNLIGNAINYTPAGGVTVKVEKVKDQIKVSVTDTGHGISEQNQVRLFKKFQQAQENILTRDVTKSTGLGLYISKMLVEAMGGTIRLEQSEVDKGSTFSFTVPIATKAKTKV